MPYCGRFGCGCCSAPCDGCGKTCWPSDLEDGLCDACRKEKVGERLDGELDNVRKLFDEFIEKVLEFAPEDRKDYVEDFGESLNESFGSMESWINNDLIN